MVEVLAMLGDLVETTLASVKRGDVLYVLDNTPSKRGTYSVLATKGHVSHELGEQLSLFEKVVFSDAFVYSPQEARFYVEGTNGKRRKAYERVLAKRGYWPVKEPGVEELKKVVKKPTRPDGHLQIVSEKASGSSAQMQFTQGNREILR